MKNKNRFNIGDRINTTQYPWSNEVFLIDAIQEVNPNRILFCKNLKNGKFVNLVEFFCFSIEKQDVFSKFTNIQIIKLVKIGNRKALKEYLKRFKQMPKFNYNGRK